jgi:PEP-CTERM motif
MKRCVSIALAAAVSMAVGQATIVYDNLGTTATAGYSEVDTNNPVYGDALNLTSGGALTMIGLSLFNSSSGGNTGAILTGSMVVSFYDNTVPYAGGALTDPLLGNAIVVWDFTAGGGLPAGFFSTQIFDLTALNIVLTQNILVTQFFTQTSGTSLRNGAVLFSDPVVGTSPSNVYIKSSGTAEGLYSFSGNPSQFGYQVQIAAPEPSAGMLAGLGLAGLMILRRHIRQRTRGV